MAPRQRDVETPRRRKRRKLGAPATVGILNGILSDGPQPKRRRGNNVTQIFGDIYDIPPSTPLRRSTRSTTKLQSSGLKGSYREESDDEDERGKRGEMDDEDGRDGIETPTNGDEQEIQNSGEDIVEEDYRAELDNEDKGDNDNKESDNGDLDNEDAPGAVSEPSHDNGDVSAVADLVRLERSSDNEEAADNGDDATPEPKERQDEEMESFEGNVVQMFSDAHEPEQDPNSNEAAMSDQIESPESSPPLGLGNADPQTDEMDDQMDTHAEDGLISRQEGMGHEKEEEEYVHNTDPDYDQYSEDEEGQDEENEEQNEESEDDGSSSKPLVELTLNDALRDWLYETTKDTAFKKDWLAIVQSIKDRQHQKEHLQMPSYLVRSYLRIQELQNFYGEIGGFVNLIESDRKEIRKLTALADIVINDADQGILNFPNWPWHEGNRLKFTRISENVETCLVPHLHILVILGFNIYYRHQDSSVGIDQFHCVLGLARETIDHLKRLWDRGCILGKRPPRTWRLARYLKRLEEGLSRRTLVPLPASSADPSHDFDVVPHRPWSKKEDATLIDGLKAAGVE